MVVLSFLKITSYANYLLLFHCLRTFMHANSYSHLIISSQPTITEDIGQDPSNRVQHSLAVGDLLRIRIVQTHSDVSQHLNIMTDCITTRSGFGSACRVYPTNHRAIYLAWKMVC